MVTKDNIRDISWGRGFSFKSCKELREGATENGPLHGDEDRFLSKKQYKPTLANFSRIRCIERILDNSREPDWEHWQETRETGESRNMAGVLPKKLSGEDIATSFPTLRYSLHSPETSMSPLLLWLISNWRCVLASCSPKSNFLLQFWPILLAKLRSCTYTLTRRKTSLIIFNVHKRPKKSASTNPHE